MRDLVEDALNRIRPTLQKDGGDVVLVDVTSKGVVKVQLTGACRDCQMSDVTLKMGIEKFLKTEVPEVTEVVAV
ncbi:MAG: NifU family protein [Proteobacteria bacterium]|nr:NifU family protein [Pseudomonadota bacterium]MBU1739869.1 NifU family protein [Pseudomonadota bacterium]